MLEFLKRAASHFLAIVLGVTTLPLISLYRSGWGIIKWGALAVISAIGVPIAYAIEIRLSYFREHTPFHNFLFQLLKYVAHTLIVALGFILTMTILIVVLPLMAIHIALITLFNGFIEGYKRGMSGYWVLYNHGVYAVGDYLDYAFSLLREARNLNDPHGHIDIPIQHDEFNQFEFFDEEPIPDNLVDVEVEHEPEMETQEAPRHTENILTEEQIKQADLLIECFGKLANPLAPAAKATLETFKSSLEQYKVLSGKLKAVHDHLNAGTLDDIEDEFIQYTEVKTPILVVKQYQENNQWKTVPTMNHVTDYDSLKTWLRGMHPNHPLSQESFRTPPPYKKPNDDSKSYPTRHIWFKLTKDYCYSSGLGELKEGIQELTIVLTEELKSNENSNIINPVDVGQTLFADSESPKASNNERAAEVLQILCN